MGDQMNWGDLGCAKGWDEKSSYKASEWSEALDLRDSDRLNGKIERGKGVMRGKTSVTVFAP